ncbi:glycosyltransferase family 4 protein [uncultured Bacteroides sp.]|uniref:glycosyltransferase family 4 protein n=1 Tax=uncultured Bacteroides sp. TaxID=162156 RepID=UPI002AAA9A67|nr:glycosyltransferase family 4 protein [uncultured Bacteroides sp.]
MKKIVYCIPSLYIPGGMERVLTIKANYLADVLGYDIYIILTDGKDKKPYYALSPNIHIIQLDIDFEILWKSSLHKKIIIYLKKQYLYKKALKDLLQKIKPDITISMLRREINFINSIKDGSIKIGEIHVNRDNFRDINNRENSSIIRKYIEKYWTWQLIKKLKLLSSFIVLTNEDKEKWKELNNVTVIPNPLPFFPESKSECDSKKVIAVGRYVNQKGFDLLIDAWCIVTPKHPDWTLNIYGGGERKPYINQVQSAGISDTCKLEGSTANIIEKYQESSIFVLSSRFEGFGMVIAEAMSCGLPVVSFACPCGPRDIIKNGIDGILVNKENIEQMAESICYLIENENIRKEMGRKARINIEKFKIEYIGKQWDLLFKELSNKKF